MGVVSWKLEVGWTRPRHTIANCLQFENCLLTLIGECILTNTQHLSNQAVFFFFIAVFRISALWVFFHLASFIVPKCHAMAERTLTANYSLLCGESSHVMLMGMAVQPRGIGIECYRSPISHNRWPICRYTGEKFSKSHAIKYSAKYI